MYKIIYVCIYIFICMYIYIYIYNIEVNDDGEKNCSI